MKVKFNITIDQKSNSHSYPICNSMKMYDFENACVCMYVQILNQSCQLTFTNNDLCMLNNTKTFFLKLKDPKQ